MTICDPAATTCAFGFSIEANVSAVQVVADVQGYFRNIRTDQLPVSLVLSNGPGSTTIPVTIEASPRRRGWADDITPRPQLAPLVPQR